MKERSLKDIFHIVKQGLPEAQELEVFEPDTPVAEALALMHKRNFSQVPVVAGRKVMGVFSYTSFAENLIKLPRTETSPLELPVEEFLDVLRFARITDMLREFIDELELKDAVLIGSENRLQGIITTIDVLRYFYWVASPYILLREIELTIRALIKASISEKELKDCIDKSLKKHYEETNREVPKCLEELTLNDCVMILRHGDTWGYFMPVFGKDRNLVYGRINRLPELRNDVFHFRGDTAVDGYDYLREARDWLLRRITKHEAYGGGVH